MTAVRVRSLRHATAWLGALLAWAATAPGAEGQTAAPILKKYCFRCHGSTKQKGGLNLEKLSQARPLVRNLGRWRHVIEIVKTGRMPPPGRFLNDSWSVRSAGRLRPTKSA